MQTEQEKPEASATTSDERTMAALAHAGGIFFGFLPSLIIWLIKKDESAYVNDQGKEALNFQIAVAIAGIIAGILVMALIGVVLIFVVWAFNIIFCILAAIQASKGEYYRYPVTLRLIK